jgi:hypothetical protein
MGKMNIMISDELENRFREAVAQYLNNQTLKCTIHQIMCL